MNARTAPRGRSRLTVVALGLALLGRGPAPAKAGGETPDAVDGYDLVLIQAARGRALPRPLAPVRRALVDRTIRELRRGDLDAAYTDWDRFAASYFGPLTAGEVSDVVEYVLRQSFIEPRPGMPRLARLANSTQYFTERALATEEYLRELSAALENRRKGFKPAVRRLTLGPKKYRRAAEPYTFTKPRSTSRKGVRQLLRDWEKKLVMVREDAVVAHLALHAGSLAEPELVRTMWLVDAYLRGSAHRTLELAGVSVADGR